MQGFAKNTHLSHPPVAKAFLKAVFCPIWALNASFLPYNNPASVENDGPVVFGFLSTHV